MDTHTTDNPRSLFVIGDSIAMQYGPYLQQYLQDNWQVVLRKGFQQANKNLDVPTGANSGNSSMVLKFLEKMAEQGGLPARVLLINCGLHDIMTDIKTGTKQIPVDQYRTNLTNIVSQARTMGHDVIWARITPCDEQVHNTYPDIPVYRFRKDCLEYNAVADEVMVGANVPSIDLYSFTCRLGEDLYCDHVHFHDHIRRLQAAFIAGYVIGNTGTT